MISFMRHAMRGNESRDVGLVSEGIAQASKLEGEYDTVIISPLRRCRETLDHSKIKYKTLVITPLCRELRNGNIIDYMENEEIVTETMPSFSERLLQFKELLKFYKDKKILVISHCVFIAYFTGMNRILNNCEIVSGNIAQ